MNRKVSFSKMARSEWFPDYLDHGDKLAMLAMCSSELEAWRKSVGEHKSLPTVEAKLKHRKSLEVAYDGLKSAWVRANECEPLFMAA
jgi:hypothetical protein